MSGEMTVHAVRYILALIVAFASSVNVVYMEV